MYLRDLAIPLLVAELLIGCQRSTEKMLIGKWKNTLPDAEGMMVLGADHVMLSLQASDRSIGVKGTWRVAGNQLYQSVEATGAKPTIPEFAWTILELDHSKLRVRTIGSTELLFLRGTDILTCI